MLVMREFILGMLVMAAIVIGLHFLRFWRRTNDRLFLFFAVAFWLMGLNYLLLAFADRDEPNTALYAVRLLAFSLIIVGIVDKNRKPALAAEAIEKPE